MAQHPEKLKWKQEVHGGLSASQFGMALGFCGRVSDYVHYLRHVVGTPQEFTGNACTDHGIRTEPKARALYEVLTGCPVYEGGFFATHDRLLGCSPDGRVFYYPAEVTSESEFARTDSSGAQASTPKHVASPCCSSDALPFASRAPTTATSQLQEVAERKSVSFIGGEHTLSDRASSSLSSLTTVTTRCSVPIPFATKRPRRTLSAVSSPSTLDRPLPQPPPQQLSIVQQEPTVPLLLGSSLPNSPSLEALGVEHRSPVVSSLPPSVLPPAPSSPVQGSSFSAEANASAGREAHRPRALLRNRMSSRKTRLLEIKSPFRALYDGEKAGYRPFGIPLHYMCQMQGQMAIADADECDFFVYLDHPHCQVEAWRVRRSTEFWKWAEPKLRSVCAWIRDGPPDWLDRNFCFEPFDFSLLQVSPLVFPYDLTDHTPLENPRKFAFFGRFRSPFSPTGSIHTSEGYCTASNAECGPSSWVLPQEELSAVADAVRCPLVRYIFDRCGGRESEEAGEGGNVEVESSDGPPVFQSMSASLCDVLDRVHSSTTKDDPPTKEESALFAHPRGGAALLEALRSVVSWNTLANLPPLASADGGGPNAATESSSAVVRISVPHDWDRGEVEVQVSTTAGQVVCTPAIRVRLFHRGFFGSLILFDPHQSMVNATECESCRGEEEDCQRLQRRHSRVGIPTSLDTKNPQHVAPVGSGVKTESTESPVGGASVVVGSLLVLLDTQQDTLSQCVRLSLTPKTERRYEEVED